MGNINTNDGLTCSETTREEYMDLRTKSWSYTEGYLYQTEI
jgi:hypothetical protein